MRFVRILITGFVALVVMVIGFFVATFVLLVGALSALGQQFRRQPPPPPPLNPTQPGRVAPSRSDDVIDI